MKQVLGVAIALILAVPAVALAQNSAAFPSYYRVTGVATDDVLNVRAAPHAGTAIMGTLAPGAEPVEVLEITDRWGQVVTGEGTGWVYMDYLAPVDVPLIGDTGLPQGLTCTGTEPFWSLTLTGAMLTYSNMDEKAMSLGVTAAAPFAGVGAARSFVNAMGGEGGITAVISTESCSDGMSDRNYARRIDLVLASSNGLTGLTGCCHLPLN